ncbi:MAG: nuclear transport factor 2 family protein [bacterium]
MRGLVNVVLVALLASTAMAAPAEKKMSTGPEAGVNAMGQAFFAAWNQHDVKSMVSHWADDATLINPMGRTAHGKAAIEALLSEEQTTVFKSSTAKLMGLTVTRSLGPSMVLCDGEMTVDGAVAPDGAALPQMKIHLALLAAKRGADWVLQDARPYQFVQPPPKMN